ncbi:DUF6153 family protein [Nocardioides sp. TF02-7]|uniref:DUF6153 family protein n=1 Tax=Nocardioides sp. TF02-7 TaxID=2917724 RepID=UPI001F064938|nr:DUF6153 family protein [Nocardioides sp. TF02-7]UMG92195.1 DUF6153 family protein [Nocardioides sp. TF02-7]
MRDLRAATRAPGARLALAAVAVALFGLMSMHGWGSHTGAHLAAPLPGPSAITAATHAHGGTTDTGDARLVMDESSEPASGHPTQAPDGDGDGGLLELCLAILAGILLGVALLLGRRRIRLARGTLQKWSLPVFIGRDRDPPDLRRLCVIRC